MSLSTSPNETGRAAERSDDRIWRSLERAIAASSGFQRWQLERYGDRSARELGEEARIRRYLRETLETLAY